MSSSKNDHPLQQSSEVEGMPGQGVRTIISLLLFMHFTCLLVIFGGIYDPSELQLRVMEVFRPYTQALALDLNQGSDFSPLIIIDHPMGFEGVYSDHQIEIDLAGEGESRTLTLPSDSFHGGLAYRRRLTLARYLAGVVQAEDASNKLASVILRHYQAQPGDQLRCVRLTPLTPEEAQAIEADPKAEAQYSTVLEVTVSHVAENGTREILRTEDVGSVAPVDVPPAADIETTVPPTSS